ncbi:MAG: hypothetical protein ACK5NG_00655 [Chthoniobacterales bacterium]
MTDTRLAITLAQSAVDHEATLLNYADVTQLAKGYTFNSVK